jgi:hypothetical protein
MGAKGGGQTIGYHYLFSMLFGLSRGPLNEVRGAKVGDKTVLDASYCGEGPWAIDKPEVFGGEKKEGGIQGPFDIFWGEADQVLPGAQAVNVHAAAGSVFSSIFALLRGGPWGGLRTLPAVKPTIGGLVSEFRGVTTLWFDGLISSMNPYPKEWRFRVRRSYAGWQNDDPWYKVKSLIFMADGFIHAMNPAHIIYQCLTDKSWGRGLSPLDLDENSFIYAANTLCTEGFGLCLAWNRKDDIDAFIRVVLEHIDAVLYQDPETGLETLKLIRSDYVVANLPLFEPGKGLVSIDEDDSSSQDTAFNEVIGTGHDPLTDEDFQMRVHNLAARYSNGAANADDKGYPGIPTRDLLARVIQRDLRKHASGLKKFAVTLDRAGFQIRPGMPFRIKDTRRGLGEIVLRAGEIEDRSYKSGRVVIKAMQDVFGMPATSFVTPIENEWQGPVTEAQPAAAERLLEVGYRDIFVRSGLAVAESLKDDQAYVGALALSPDPASYEYLFATRVDGEPSFQSKGNGSFTGSATLAEDVAPFQTTFDIANLAGFDEANIGQAILVGNELMELADFDPLTNTVTVARGVADTIPAAHVLGARVWTIDDDLMGDTRAYAAGETVEGVVLPKTSSDTLDPDEADILEITLAGRQAAPYPPANVMLNGGLALDPTVLPVSAVEPLLEWAHRDRVLQQDSLIAYTEGSIGPEPGVTYNIRLFDPADMVTPIREETAIAGDTWTYTAAMQAADTPPSHLKAEIESERDGIVSWQTQAFDIYLNAGYGGGYGMDYGGT